VQTQFCLYALCTITIPYHRQQERPAAGYRVDIDFVLHNVITEAYSQKCRLRINIQIMSKTIKALYLQNTLKGCVLNNIPKAKFVAFIG
jgi:hypothetical protein